MMEVKPTAQQAMVEEFWRSWFMEGPPKSKIRRQRFYKFLPGESRCIFCHAPFDGYTAPFIKNILGVYQSRFNPHYCNTCDDFSKKYQGGAEIPLTMLFADIRGSTSLAEKADMRSFSELINRFYVKSSSILGDAGAMIEKLAGDEVSAAFTKGMAGEDYTGSAIRAAKALLRETGHVDDEPWVKIGIGIHSGTAFIGSVGKPNGLMEVAVLGDVPNTAARLTANAATGEILVSEDAARAAGLEVTGTEERTFNLKGREQQITAYVLHC